MSDHGPNGNGNGETLEEFRARFLEEQRRNDELRALERRMSSLETAMKFGDDTISAKLDRLIDAVQMMRDEQIELFRQLTSVSSHVAAIEAKPRRARKRTRKK